MTTTNTHRVRFTDTRHAPRVVSEHTDLQDAQDARERYATGYESTIPGAMLDDGEGGCMYITRGGSTVAAYWVEGRIDGEWDDYIPGRAPETTEDTDVRAGLPLTHRVVVAGDGGRWEAGSFVSEADAREWAGHMAVAYAGEDGRCVPRPRGDGSDVWRDGRVEVSVWVERLSSVRPDATGRRDADEVSDDLLLGAALPLLVGVRARAEGLTVGDLDLCMGTPGGVREVLWGHRSLTVVEVAKLADLFGVTVSGLVEQAERLVQTATARRWTPEQEAALIASNRAANAELAAWSAGVQDGTIELQGVELDAYRAGRDAAEVGLSERERRETTVDFTPRQRIAYAVGYGRAMAEQDGDQA